MKDLVRKSVLLIGLVLSFASQANDLVPLKMLNGKVTISTPRDFVPMSKEIIEIKYPSSRRPTEVLTEQTTEVTLAFNYTNNKLSKTELSEAHKIFSKSFHNLYPSATWVRDELIQQNGHPFVVLELITPAIDTKIHNIVYATSVDGRLLLVSFNTTVGKAEEWLAQGKQMMKSIVIN
ncbi:hypothetical protein FG475_22895 [Vibrio navarrensis]|uniref:hypothetical protein n=1 Tax=Vibrio cholerae TaxID=666 RepID=UPI0012AEC570|nr:hypothetical protein [Vibrio cholerae]EHA1127847.1 hypothetical protein [Vibrio navarrensis]HDI3134834.1 hypothetical protein [Vibrio cholerae]